MMDQNDVDAAFEQFYDKQIHFPEDCVFICEVIKEKFGIDITIKQAQEFWTDRSDNWAASWLHVGRNPTHKEEICNTFQRFIQENMNDL